MAICLRPAFSYRSILLLHCRHLSHTIHSPNLTDTASLNPSDTASLNPSSTQDFLRESPRSFANGRKSSTPLSLSQVACSLVCSMAHHNYLDRFIVTFMYFTEPSTLSIRDFLRESRRSFAKGRKSSNPLPPSLK